MSLGGALLRQAVEEITREGAREAARDELRDQIYRAAEPSTADRIIAAIRDWLGERFAEAVRFAPGGLPTILVLVGVFVLLGVLVRIGAGPFRRADALTDTRRGARAMTAADYRAEAERLAAQGEYKEAVRARFRATVRELEERGVLDPRPGRTAGEAAAEAGILVPGVAADLRGAADLFGAVWYGGLNADEDTHARLRAADDAVRSARLMVRT